MDSGPTSPNNKSVKSGRKIQRTDIGCQCLRVQSGTCNNAEKYPRSCPNSVINSLEFFLVTVVFLRPFFLSSAFSFCVPLFEFLFVLYTMISAPFSPSTCELGVGNFSVPSRTSLNLLLLAVRLLIYCSGITSTLMRPESWLGSI